MPLIISAYKSDVSLFRDLVFSQKKKKDTNRRQLFSCSIFIPQTYEEHARGWRVESDNCRRNAADGAQWQSECRSFMPQLLRQLFMHSFSEVGSKLIFLLNHTIAVYLYTGEKHNSVLSCRFSRHWYYERSTSSTIQCHITDWLQCQAKDMTFVLKKCQHLTHRIITRKSGIINSVQVFSVFRLYLVTH